VLYESLTRLLLLDADFPAPQTQIPVCDEFGQVFARLDMGWRQYRVAVEYDGAQHWTDGKQRAWDIHRMALVEAAGWVVIRVSANMLSRPQVICDRVATALLARGCPKTW
jgi:very-short-patch-repair endonuclease